MPYLPYQLAETSTARYLYNWWHKLATKRLISLALQSAGSGTIDATELRATLEALGQKPTDEELFLMIAQVDEDNSGEIEFAEFLKVRRIMQRPCFKMNACLGARWTVIFRCSFRQLKELLDPRTALDINVVSALAASPRLASVRRLTEDYVAVQALESRISVLQRRIWQPCRTASLCSVL
jgi:hypothetical protein